ncbi:hypothetical protein [Rhizobium sp. 768_B6_N1_8]|uniref:hypothetical protein n=1 Tax=unclassified Rhizobium TaxID=2613769 RepID=UPI003F23BDCA
MSRIKKLKRLLCVRTDARLSNPQGADVAVSAPNPGQKPCFTSINAPLTVLLNELDQHETSALAEQPVALIAKIVLEAPTKTLIALMERGAGQVFGFHAQARFLQLPEIRRCVHGRHPLHALLE